MKGATLADAAITNAEELYEQLRQARIEIEKLTIENQLIKELLGE